MTLPQNVRRLPMGPQLPHSDQVHAEKYRGEGESFREAMGRVASGITDNDAHYQEFREILLNMRFMPAGRIQAAIGSPKHITPYNCFVAGTIHDSFAHGSEGKDDSIMDTSKQAAQTMRMGGGIGYDWSTLRPSGDLIRGVQSKTDGPLAFMPIMDAVCKATSSAGNRRGAQMGVLRVDHPDIFKYIRAKQPSDEMQHLWDAVEELPADYPGRPDRQRAAEDPAADRLQPVRRHHR
jgi:ribonucleoside-diphosphate reductase alpha chain